MKKSLSPLMLLSLMLAVTTPYLHGGKISVESADPSSAEQGQSLIVTIKGRGFAQGSVAEFLLTGTANPAGVVVNSTTFVDSKTLRADVDVTGTAEIGNFDIEVYANGRTGKGIEKFAVHSPGGGGGPICSVSFDWQSSLTELSASRLFPGTSPVLDGEDFSGRRIGKRIAAIETDPGVFLVAIASSESANVASQTWITLLSFDGSSWSHIDSWEVSEGCQPILTYLDGDATVDLVHASGTYFDVVNSSSPQYQIVPPADSEDFGGGGVWAVGDVDSGNPGQEIIVGDRVQGAVYLFDSSGVKLGKLMVDGITGSDRFGASVLASASGELYVGAYWADESKKTRDSGKVFHFPSGVDCVGSICGYTDMLTLSRGIKNERLGGKLALGDIDGDSTDDLVASPTNSAGESLAVFHAAGGTTALNFVQAFGLIDSVSSSDVSGGPLDDVFAGASNAEADSGSCGNAGAVYAYFDGNPNPVIVRSPDAIEDNLFFGRGLVAIGGYLFVTEMGRDIDGDGTDDGQIYVFVE